ncbi:DUF4126 domain-containing protein [Microbacterium sp. Au-Mic1]|uniref:DUF4126 domain-containing protein n=1 Tax=Microbacterium sp. Au-Mic1 TaxID=2906457 RepID=UPI001E323750|nr:DUF4126 domain-containing protein [Microbacterium sp. Au-Mic1]MCE4024480.1 DUF4126 domain-containing protein [Microbacterium sp. Au-Mic1]
MIEFVIGSSLAAAADLNAWIPLFLLGLAAKLLPAVALPAGWSWLGSDIALWIIGALLVLEIVADKIPALDSLNDIVHSIVRPAAGGIAFGAGASARTVAVDDPGTFFSEHTWIPIVAGIVIALAVHAVKATGRVAANAATAGVAAPVLSTTEDIAAFLLSATAIIVPVVAAILLVALIVGIAVVVRRRSRRRDARAVAE